MRVWGLLLAWAASAGLAGCAATQQTMYADIARPAPIAPKVLAKQLMAAQRDWPRPPKPTDCRRVRCVALTFDDGPGEYTGRLLDMLDSHRVKATFFVVGQMVAADKEGNVRRIAAAGHELGNHSWSHAQLTRLSTGALRYELDHTQDLVEHLTGVRMRVMRPPYGSTDGRVATETKHEGLAQILWNVDTLDWRDRVASTVSSRASKAKPGSIVLMHDIHKSTVDAVPSLLKRLSGKGYTFVTISELYGKPPAPGRKYTER